MTDTQAKLFLQQLAGTKMWTNKTTFDKLKRKLKGEDSNLLSSIEVYRYARCKGNIYIVDVGNLVFKKRDDTRKV